MCSLPQCLSFVLNALLKVTLSCASWFWLSTSLAYAFEPNVQKVTDTVYAIVGDIDQRSAENPGYK